MNIRRSGFGSLLIVMLASVFVLGGFAQGETALERMVAEGDTGWMIGRWVANTDEGELTLVYRWAVEKNIIIVAFTMGDYSYQGMIYCVPGEEKVIEVGVDSKGATTKSEWNVTWDGVVSKREVSQVDGQTQEMGLVNSKVDKDSMKLKVYGIEWGSLASNPSATIDFERKPLQRRGTRTRDAGSTK